MSNEPMPVIKLPGGATFTCPQCGWTITLTPLGAELWTNHGEITPSCAQCDVDLTRTDEAKEAKISKEIEG